MLELYLKRLLDEKDIERMVIFLEAEISYLHAEHMNSTKQSFFVMPTIKFASKLIRRLFLREMI